MWLTSSNCPSMKERIFGCKSIRSLDPLCLRGSQPSFSLANQWKFCVLPVTEKPYHSCCKNSHDSWHSYIGAPLKRFWALQVENRCSMFLGLQRISHKVHWKNITLFNFQNVVSKSRIFFEQVLSRIQSLFLIRKWNNRNEWKL